METSNIHCEICNTDYKDTYFYRLLIEKNNNICKTCLVNKFNDIKSRLNEEAALFTICEKYELFYDFEIYTKLKNNSKTNSFRKYMTYISSLNKKIFFGTIRNKFNKYISLKNIKIENPFTFDYNDILNKSGLIKLLNDYNIDILEFIVRYNKHNFAGYKFKFYSETYYSKKENLIFELKYFIKQDKKIPLSKLPDILNFNYLQENNETLNYIIRKGNPYKNLYEWVNDCFPNYYKPRDFGKKKLINFDSNEEKLVHEELKKFFPNILYNDRRNINIKLDCMVPDWFIFTKSSVIIVEYFGLYHPNPSTQIELDYYKNANNKIKKYKKFKNYKFIFIYPSDLKNKFDSLHDKIKILLSDIKSVK